MPIQNSNLLTTQRMPHPVNQVLVQEYLRRSMGAMPHAMFAVKKNHPANQGDTVTWMRMDNPTAQITPVPEGQDPTPIMPSRTTLSAQLKEYKAVIKPSKKLIVTGVNSDSVQWTDWLADCRAITLDTLYRNVMAGGASSVTCSHGSPSATLLNETDIDTIVTNLRGANAIKLKKMLGASTGIGTSPISAAFVGLMHEDLRHDLKNVSGFKEVKDYSNPADAYPDEFGSTGEVRWILTTNGYKSGSNYSSLIIAEQAVGGVTLDDLADPLIYKPPEQAGSPTDAYCTYAFVEPHVVRILNDNYMGVLISTKS